MGSSGVEAVRRGKPYAVIAPHLGPLARQGEVSEDRNVCPRTLEAHAKKIKAQGVTHRLCCPYSGFFIPRAGLCTAGGPARYHEASTLALMAINRRARQ